MLRPYLWNAFELDDDQRRFRKLSASCVQRRKERTRAAKHGRSICVGRSTSHGGWDHLYKPTVRRRVVLPRLGERSTASWPPELHFPTVNVRLQQGNALSHTPPGLGKFMVNSAGWFSHRLPQRSQLRGYQSTASFSTGEPRMKSNPSHHQYGCSCTLDF